MALFSVYRVWLWGAGLVLLATASLSAAPELATYTTRFYNVHTNLSREEAVEYGRHMDLLFQDYAKRFRGFRARGGEKNNLFLLRTREDYIRQMAKYGFDASASGGVFFTRPNISGLATWVDDRPKAQTLATLQHEGFHQFASTYIGHTLPLWVNEGLATYFEQAKVVAGKLKSGIAESARIAVIQQAVEQDQQMPFAELLNLDSDQWHWNMRSGSPMGSLQYTQSWAVVYFLIHGDGGKYQRAFEQYLTLLSKGRRHDQAYDKVFGRGSEPAFEERWKLFVADLEPDAYSAALDEMMFIAYALKWLADREPDALPETMAGLRERLQAMQFRTTQTSGAGGPTFEISATDDSVWTYEDARGQEHPYEMLKPAGTIDLPRITAGKLRPQPVVGWHTYEDREPEPEMTFR